MADDIWNAAAASLRDTGSTAIAAALILTLCRRSAPLVMNKGVACLAAGFRVVHRAVSGKGESHRFSGREPIQRGQAIMHLTDGDI
jgi:hypothetical protein